MRGRVAVGVDVGGTKIAAARVTADGTLEGYLRRDTPREQGEALVALLVDIITELAGRAGRPPVGIGFPSLVTRDGHVRYGPNVPLGEYPLATELAVRTGRDVTLDNDANAATWAEFVLGAGRGTTDLAMFTLGTGVGGGLVLDSRLVRGGHGFAGELGHAIVEVDGRIGPSGLRGEVEAYASGGAIAEIAGRPGEEVSAAAKSGDAEAVAVLRHGGRMLGAGMATVVNLFDPQVVVVGGGALAEEALIVEAAREGLREHLFGSGHRPEPPVVPAQLGADAGVIGAGLLALGVGLDDPPGRYRRRRT